MRGRRSRCIFSCQKCTRKRACSHTVNTSTPELDANYNRDLGRQQGNTLQKHRGLGAQKKLCRNRQNGERNKSLGALSKELCSQEAKCQRTCFVPIRDMQLEAMVSKECLSLHTRATEASKIYGRRVLQSNQFSCWSRA